MTANPIIKKIYWRWNLNFSELYGGFQLAQYSNLQKTVNALDEKFDVGSMINKALIGILISKEIVTEKEMEIILGKIYREQEIYFEKNRSY